jgi:hypothetical protein
MNQADKIMFFGRIAFDNNVDREPFFLIQSVSSPRSADSRYCEKALKGYRASKCEWWILANSRAVCCRQYWQVARDSFG